VRKLIAALRPTPQQQIDDLIKLVATLRGEAESWRVRHDYHCQYVAHIDPHADWWGFAHHKQACHEAAIERDAINVKIAKHATKLEELMSAGWTNG
jgi:hypothetical protein